MSGRRTTKTTAPRRAHISRSNAKAKSKPARRYWSRAVTEHSNAMDLEDSVFRRTPKEIARSIKRSADRSQRRKSSPFRSAMSMITFYENRAGKNLSAARRRALDQAKVELRRLYGTPALGAADHPR
jgi:hypothetical protein